MDENNIYMAVGGIISTLSASFFSYVKGKKKRKIEEENEIIKQYQFAMDSLRSEFERRLADMQKEIDTLKEHICYVSSCKRRKI